MGIPKTSPKIRYRYAGGQWQEVEGKNPATGYEFIRGNFPTGRTIYSIYGQWVSNGWYPNRVDFIANLASYCPPNLFLSFNGTVQGVVHSWANAGYCPNANRIPANARLSPYGSWANIWIASSSPELSTRTSGRCNLYYADANNQSAVIYGDWDTSCPEIQVISASCPDGYIDCSDCCISCDELTNKIKALI